MARAHSDAEWQDCDGNERGIKKDLLYSMLGPERLAARISVSVLRIVRLPFERLLHVSEQTRMKFVKSDELVQLGDSKEEVNEDERFHVFQFLLER